MRFSRPRILASFIAIAAFATTALPLAFAVDQTAVRFETVSYADKIVYLDQNSKNLMVARLILGMEQFRELWDQAPQNIGESLRFLASPEHSERQIRQQRLIAILTMHRLVLPDYIRFMHEMIALYRRGAVSSAELDLAFNPGPDFSDIAVQYYRNAEVQDIMRAIRVRTGIPAPEKAAIDDLLARPAGEDGNAPP